MYYQKSYILYREKSTEAKSYRDKRLQHEKELLNLLIETKEYQIGSVVDSSTSLQDPEVYELIKKTWIGERIDTLSQLHRILSEKQQEKQFDLSQLLAL